MNQGILLNILENPQEYKGHRLKEACKMAKELIQVKSINISGLERRVIELEKDNASLKKRVGKLSDSK